MTRITDRELLELAAKAAGVEHQGIYYRDRGLRIGDRSNGYATWIEWWNPLGNAGDAFVLAAKLNIALLPRHVNEHGELVARAITDDVVVDVPIDKNGTEALARATVCLAAHYGRWADQIEVKVGQRDQRPRR